MITYTCIGCGHVLTTAPVSTAGCPACRRGYGWRASDPAWLRIDAQPGDRFGALVVAAASATELHLRAPSGATARVVRSATGRGWVALMPGHGSVGERDDWRAAALEAARRLTVRAA